MQRTYDIVVRVTVEDEHPDDPENEENVTYAAYAAAKAALADNTASWDAVEVLDG